MTIYIGCRQIYYCFFFNGVENFGLLGGFSQDKNMTRFYEFETDNLALLLTKGILKIRFCDLDF